MPPSPPVVTRFAPSPTGHLHIGGARTALFCWAFARRNGGHFVLRIEDTDQARSSDESAKGIMEDLAWLGIDWDEGPELKTDGRTIGGDPRSVGPFFQARRVAIYNKYIMQLVERGRAYPAFETPEVLEAKRKAAVAAKQTYRYDRAALREVPDIKDRLKRIESGEPHVVRFLAPAEEVVVHDQVLGDVKYAAGEMDDFVIRKADGFPTYHFAVVVDDETMGVTHVLRAQEHLNNTPRHVALQRAIVREDQGGRSFITPSYAHMPLIMNMDGSKMGKRDRDKAARIAFTQYLEIAPRPKAVSQDLFELSLQWITKSKLAPSTKQTRESIIRQAWGSLPAETLIDTEGTSDQKVLALVWQDLLQTVSEPVYKSHLHQWRAFLRAIAYEQFSAWLVDSSMQLPSDRVDALAVALEANLPEIEVNQFRAAGYLPNAITNFISLLGWNPGMKTPDGKDLEKFDTGFLAEHFDINRVGKSSAKFDRAKLLSFNADAINAMTDEAFADAWRDWCHVHEHALAANIDEHRWLILAKAVKQRAKTMRDAVKSAAFVLRPDECPQFDTTAVEKNLFANDRAGLKLLREFQTVLPTIEPFEPVAINAAIEALAKSKGVGMGAVAQPIRIAVAGLPVSPPLGETLAVLGRPSAENRIATCLMVLSE